jgi:hypothetical protein
VNTPEERTVVDVSPLKETREMMTEGKLPDADPHFVMADGLFGKTNKNGVAEMGMGIETPEIGRQDGCMILDNPEIEREIIETAKPRFTHPGAD